MKNFFYWLPKIFAAIYTVLVSLFALNIFSENYSLPENILSLLLYIAPSLILLIFMWIAWKKAQLGGLLFLALGTAYAILTYGHFPNITLVLVSGPLFLIGILFLFQPKKGNAINTVKIAGEKEDITQMT